LVNKQFSRDRRGLTTGAPEPLDALLDSMNKRPFGNKIVSNACMVRTDHHKDKKH
jgi:hypothetical protein